ncbi:MAG: hypothetical protein ACUVTM_00215 [Candidatus Bathyarchaeia archaeon]
MRQTLASTLIIMILISSLAGLDVTSGSDRQVEMSPGKVPPQNINHYLKTPEVQVKLEYPKAMILQETFGDLVFNITIQTKRRTIALYIPYEFGLKQDTTHVWSSITNDYRFISLSRLSGRDPVAPNWFRVTVSNGSSSIWSGSHIIRLFNVTAPSIVGRYFFKIFIDGSSIGAENFPTLVVSADPNPAYISGTVLDCSSGFFRYTYGYGGYTYGYGGPIQLREPEGGKVVAEGVSIDGRKVVGQAYFGASVAGRYTIYGLAAGTYNLTAYAAGYKPTPLGRLVTVKAGQSLDGVDLCVYASPRIEGVVWSKCGGMLHQWGAVATRSGPSSGAALTYIGGGVYPGRDFIYSFRGANTSDFLRYDAAADRWEYMQPAPGPVGSGGSLTFDGERYIYAFQGGGSNSFFIYDVASDEWQTGIVAPSSIGDGGSLCFNQNDGLIYALRGGGTMDFWVYDPVQNRWDNRTSTPGIVSGGGSLTFNVVDGNIYALQGGGTPSFWRYDPRTDTWTTLPDMPYAAQGGAALTYSLSGSIYAIVGGGSVRFLSYTSLGWTQLADIPTSTGPGGSLTFDKANGLIYAVAGGAEDPKRFYSYTPDSWTSRSDFPILYPRPVTIEILTSVDESLRLIRNYTDPTSYSHNFKHDGSTDLDGHIPQDSSGYVSGIWPGTYKIRVYVNQYVQPKDFEINIPEGMAGVKVEFDIHRTGVVEVTVHFKDRPQGRLIPVTLGRAVSIGLYDKDAILRGRNSTLVKPGSTSCKIKVTGFLGTIHDYGLPAGIYSVEVTAEGYYQPSDFYLTVAGCDSIAEVSMEVLRTGSITMTIRSVNTQSPPQPVEWRYPGSPIRVEVRDQYNALTYASWSLMQVSSRSSVNLYVNNLRTGIYTIQIFTFGYIQKKPQLVSVIDGGTADTTVDLVTGGFIDTTIILEKEDLPSIIDTYRYSTMIPLRIEVYDDLDEFVAANITHIPSNLNVHNLRLAGFRRYAGNNACRWVNFYDTTDGSLQRDYGLKTGTYRLIVYVPGFSQLGSGNLVTVQEGGGASLTVRLKRLAHLYGMVTCQNMFGEVVPLNWAVIDVFTEGSSAFTCSLDGFYELWIIEGRYLLTCSLKGYETSTCEATLSKGSDVNVDFRLRTLAIPEFGSLGYLVTILILLIAMTLLKSRKNLGLYRASKTL